MRLKDEVIIEATSDKVWEYVGSPEMWPLFHAKAGECKQVGPRADLVGARYDIQFRLGSKRTVTRCEILDRRVGRSIVVRSTLPETDPRTGRTISARLTYELEDLGCTTRVTEEIEFPGTGIPLLLRPLVWLITRFGKPRGNSTLIRLKEIVEH